PAGTERERDATPIRTVRVPRSTARSELTLARRTRLARAVNVVRGPPVDADAVRVCRESVVIRSRVDEDGSRQDSIRRRRGERPRLLADEVVTLRLREAARIPGGVVVLGEDVVVDCRGVSKTRRIASQDRSRRPFGVVAKHQLGRVEDLNRPRLTGVRVTA